jgi:hypothetical protein
MQFAKSIMLKSVGLKTFISLVSLSSAVVVSAQTNSPYSRYGLGDAAPSSNITTRGMGGISAGYSDIISINFNNPASYASFYAAQEAKSKKMQAGRVIFDAGINLENRSLVEPNTTQRFTASDLYFSYLQVGIPLRRNWGLSFGIRPLTRVSYKINQNERLYDPVTGNPIDSAITQYNGSGGSYLPTIGTGFGIGNLTAGVNMGYFFGNKDLTTQRALVNDSVGYLPGEFKNSYSYGSLFFNAGLQYKIELDKKGGKFIRLGAAGNWKQTINGSQDKMVQTFSVGSNGETLPIDSVYQQTGIKGEIIYPSNYTAGFTFNNYKGDGRGFLFGVDYSIGKWSEYRFFGQPDSVQDSWKIQAGGQINPKPGNAYFSRVSYRFGFSLGTDYIKVQEKLPLFGATFGMALPIRSSRLAPNQFNAVNLSFEFLKRGNGDNLLKENMFRLSAGFSFTDLWFIKRKYE